MNPTNSINQKVDLIIKNAGELLTLSASSKEESQPRMERSFGWERQTNYLSQLQ
jgi:hypothetical protein